MVLLLRDSALATSVSTPPSLLKIEYFPLQNTYLPSSHCPVYLYINPYIVTVNPPPLPPPPPQPPVKDLLKKFDFVTPTAAISMADVGLVSTTKPLPTSESLSDIQNVSFSNQSIDDVCRTFFSTPPPVSLSTAFPESHHSPPESDQSQIQTSPTDQNPKPASISAFEYWDADESEGEVVTESIATGSEPDPLLHAEDLENIALAWASQFATNNSTFERNFSLLGVGETDDSPLWLQERNSVFKFYASGRRFCTGLLAMMELKSRHDLISRLYNMVVPCKDEITFDVYMNDDSKDQVVFALARKKLAKKMQKELRELQRFAGLVNPPNGRTWVAEELQVESESKKVATDLITKVVLDQVFDDKALEKFGKGFISIRFSDQHPSSLFLIEEPSEFPDLTWDDFRKPLLEAAQACSVTRKGKHKLTNVAHPEFKNSRVMISIVSPEKNQGSCGSCWTFSTTGALEAGAQAFGKGISMPIQQLVDCVVAFDNFGCNGGMPSQAFEYIKYAGGLETEGAYPYTRKNGFCKYFFENGSLQVINYVNITLGAEDELKLAVALVRPVSVSFLGVDVFKSYIIGVYTSITRVSTWMDVNHDVLAVGYGDENRVPYWLIKNLCGTDQIIHFVCICLVGFRATSNNSTRCFMTDNSYLLLVSCNSIDLGSDNLNLLSLFGGWLIFYTEFLPSIEWALLFMKCAGRFPFWPLLYDVFSGLSDECGCWLVRHQLLGATVVSVQDFLLHCHQVFPYQIAIPLFGVSDFMENIGISTSWAATSFASLALPYISTIFAFFGLIGVRIRGCILIGLVNAMVKDGASMLPRPFRGDRSAATLLKNTLQVHLMLTPVTIIGLRDILRQGKIIKQALIHWEGLAPHNATWEDVTTITKDFLHLHLEDKVIFDAPGNDTPDATLLGPYQQPISSNPTQFKDEDNISPMPAKFRPIHSRKAPEKLNDNVVG